MLRHADGATVDEIGAATGWQPHTVRGAAPLPYLDARLVPETPWR
jgi:hypothetical protein